MTEPSAARKVLVACLGNPDRGDDGIGAVVAGILAGRLPPGAELCVRSGDLLALADECAGFDALICVDADASMGAPGRLHRIDLEQDDLPPELCCTSTHGFGLAEAIGLARALQRAPQRIVVYAVEACCFDAGAAITPAVAGAARETAMQVAREAARLQQGE